MLNRFTSRRSVFRPRSPPRRGTGFRQNRRPLSSCRFLLVYLYSRTPSRATPGAPPLKPRQRRCLCTPQGASRPLTRRRICFGGKPPKQMLGGEMKVTGISLFCTAQRNFFKTTPERTPSSPGMSRYCSPPPKEPHCRMASSGGPFPESSHGTAGLWAAECPCAWTPHNKSAERGKPS